jgi:hypothetical protein
MDEDTEIGILDDARHGAAALLGASPDTIAIATSFTEALNQVAWWLRPGRGQNVVSSEVDFPSVTYPWHRIAEDTGCQVRLVGVLDDPDSFDVNKIADSVDSATAAICISHVQYLTGHLLDLCELAALAHDIGAVLIVDATQSAGQVPIDVTASGVDVLISGSYKWLCSTFGAAVCYLSPALLSEFRPPLVGWRSTEHPYSLDARWLPLAARRDRLPARRLHPFLRALLQQQRRHRPRPGDPRRGAAMTVAARRASRRCGRASGRRGERVTMSRASATGPGRSLAVAGCSEASSDVVVDRANVLHERVHARGAHEAISLSFQLLGKRLRLWCGRGDVGDGSRRGFARSLVGLCERRQAGRRGPHRSRVVNGGLDLGTVADD